MASLGPLAPPNIDGTADPPTLRSAVNTDLNGGKQDPSLLSCFRGWLSGV